MPRPDQNWLRSLRTVYIPTSTQCFLIIYQTNILSTDSNIIGSITTTKFRNLEQNLNSHTQPGLPQPCLGQSGIFHGGELHGVFWKGCNGRLNDPANKPQLAQEHGTRAFWQCGWVSGGAMAQLHDCWDFKCPPKGLYVQLCEQCPCRLPIKWDLFLHLSQQGRPEPRLQQDLEDD